MTDTPWTVVVHHDGHAITGHVPIDAWETASILAHIVTGITGRTVSVMAAAFTATDDPPAGRPSAPQLTIYDELGTMT